MGNTVGGGGTTVFELSFGFVSFLEKNVKMNNVLFVE
jgi:hypothetical protein